MCSNIFFKHNFVLLLLLFLFFFRLFWITPDKSLILTIQTLSLHSDDFFIDVFIFYGLLYPAVHKNKIPLCQSLQVNTN